MVALAARSLTRVDGEVTLQQCRTLVVLETFGPQPSAEVARRLEVAPSTVTRMCDRLVRRELVRRFHREDDRRLVCLGLTERGRDLVGEIMRARRDEIADLVGAAGIAASAATVRVLLAFTEAVGEVPDPRTLNARVDDPETRVHRPQAPIH